MPAPRYDLKLRLSLGKETADLDILLQGPAKKHLIPKLPAIASFVAERIDIQYIPAIRPSDLATGVVEYLLGREGEGQVLTYHFLHYKADKKKVTEASGGYQEKRHDSRLGSYQRPLA